MGTQEPEIEGEWKGLVIRIVKEEDEEALKAHLRANFYLDEPLSKCMGYSDEFGLDFDKMWIAFIPHRLSLIAVDKETNQVAGVRITLEHRKDFDWSVFDLTSWQMQGILHYFGQLDKVAKVFDTCQVDRYADFFLVSVDSQYRNIGLASELYRRSVSLLKAHNFPLIKCVFSSPYTRRACDKLGFRELARVKFSDGVNEETGEKYIPNALPDEVVTLGVLEI